MTTQPEGTGPDRPGNEETSMTATLVQKVGDYLADLRMVDRIDFDIPASELTVETTDGTFVLKIEELGR